jgi:hypothetical protein
MPRDYEIMMPFRQAIKPDKEGRLTISTPDYVIELECVNWHFTLRTANRWIKMHTTTFHDISLNEGVQPERKSLMGFPSPATDYVEQRIALNEIFMPNPTSTFMIETATGCLLVDRAPQVSPGDLVAFQIKAIPYSGSGIRSTWWWKMV